VDAEVPLEHIVNRSAVNGLLAWAGSHAG